MSSLQNSISLLGILSEAEEKGCPLPTQNIDLNLKNRNKAFKKYNYGPADPRHDLNTDVDKLDYANLKESDFKSKEELIGDIVGLLQSPAKNVISALKSSGGKLSGILKTLSQKEG